MSDSNSLVYGGWRLKRSRFFYGFLSVETAAVFVSGALVFMSLLWAKPFTPLFVAGFVVALVLALRWEGRSVASKLWVEISWRVASARGYGNFASPVAVPAVPEGERVELPGVLGGTSVSEMSMQGLENFGLVVNDKMATATWIVHSSDPGLADESSVKVWVDNWAGFLSSMCYQPQIDHLSVTVSSHRDPSCLVSTHLDRELSDDAPPAARKLISDLIETEAKGTPLVETRVSVCFDTRRSERKGSLEDKLGEVAVLVKGISDDLARCGVEPVLASSAELAGILRSTYAPNERLSVQEALINGDTAGLTWGDGASPNVTQEHRDYFSHNGFYTKAFAWNGGPRNQVPSNVLARVLAPGDYTKAVTLTFKPTPSHKAAKILETNRNAAETKRLFKGKNARGATARELHDEALAGDSAMAEARGAGLIDMVMVATTTVEELDDLASAETALKTSAVASKVSLRPATASHGAYLAATLPAGILISDLAKKRFN